MIYVLRHCNHMVIIIKHGSQPPTPSPNLENVPPSLHEDWPIRRRETVAQISYQILPTVVQGPVIVVLHLLKTALPSYLLKGTTDYVLYRP